MKIICEILLVLLVWYVGYNIIKRHALGQMRPWNGNVELAMVDKSFFEVRWNNVRWAGEDASIKGLLLLGVTKWDLPEINIVAPLVRGGTTRDVCYRFVENRKGVCVVFDKPLDGREISSFGLEVRTSRPWKNGKFDPQTGTYGEYSIVSFSKPLASKN